VTQSADGRIGSEPRHAIQGTDANRFASSGFFRRKVAREGRRFDGGVAVTRSLGRLTCILALVASLQGCHKDTEQDLKQKIVGNWREVRTKNEFLNFNPDGTVQMQSPLTNDTCEYDIPDTQHLSFNCAPQGAPPRPQVWKLQFQGDQLLISDGVEVGTYARQ
jgi:hypothetical protein